MALLDNCRNEIAEYNGLNLLIDFLMETPSNYTQLEGLDNNNKSSESELSACERVLQKAAIAISRFCRENKYSILLVELGGIDLMICLFKIFYSFKKFVYILVIPRLSQLCRNPTDRNNSDSVLVACLVN